MEPKFASEKRIKGRQNHFPTEPTSRVVEEAEGSQDSNFERTELSPNNNKSIFKNTEVSGINISTHENNDEYPFSPCADVKFKTTYSPDRKFITRVVEPSRASHIVSRV